MPSSRIGAAPPPPETYAGIPPLSNGMNVWMVVQRQIDLALDEPRDQRAAVARAA